MTLIYNREQGSVRGTDQVFTCKAEGLSAITSAASLRAREAFCSPFAAMTWNEDYKIKIDVFNIKDGLYASNRVSII